MEHNAYQTSQNTFHSADSFDRTWEDDSAYQIASYSIPDIWVKTQGEGVRVAVLDSGCFTSHRDLIGNIGNEYDTITGKNTVIDKTGHGTFVSGIIAGKSDGIGIHGVAPKAKILPIRVLYETTGMMQWVAEGIHKAIDLNADIINLSVGTYKLHQPTEDALKRAYQRGIPVVAAAGNESFEDSLNYPASSPYTISVGAIDDMRSVADFSNNSEHLDFVAPGVRVISSWINNEYRGGSGTSFSAPWISGVIALMISKHRKIGGNTPLNNVQDIYDHLKKVSVDLGPTGRDPKYGHGVIDVKKALSDLRPPNHDIDPGDINPGDINPGDDVTATPIQAFTPLPPGGIGTKRSYVGIGVHRPQDFISSTDEHKHL